MKPPSASRTSFCLAKTAIFFFLLITGIVSSARCQFYEPSEQIIRIGETLPESFYQITHAAVDVKAGEKTTLKLDTYRSKLIILDFWATWCGPCITSLKKLNDLQMRFSDRLAILPVTYEKSKTVLPFLIKKQWNLPSIVSDSVLTQFFPHVSIPHQVWIMNDTVLAIVGPEYATAANIEGILQGKKVRMHIKKEVPDFDASKPLLVNGNGGDARILLYQSVITKRINTRKSGQSRRKNHIAIYNAKPISLYQEAFRHTISYTGRRNRIILDMSDSLQQKILVPDKELTGNYEKDTRLRTRLANNTYCYSLTFPDKMPEKEMYDIMQDDLNHFFGSYLGVNGYVEKRKVLCLILVRTTQNDRLKTSGATPSREKEGNLYRLVNKPFQQFYANLIYANWKCPYPILDETGYNGNIDIHLTTHLDNLPQIRKELIPYGLDLVKKERWLDMLVISEI